MRRLTFVPLVLAALFTTIAFAAPPDRKSGTFDDLAVQGAQGKVDLMAKGPSETLIHGSVRQLEPQTEYEAIFYQNSTCSPEAEVNVIERFTTNPVGIGQFNGKVQKDLSQINSVSIRRVSDLVLAACASVN